MVTLTTVGYGDIVPETVAGKVIAGTIIMMGLLVIAVPIVLITSSYGDYYTCYHNFLLHTRRDDTTSIENKVHAEAIPTVTENLNYTWMFKAIILCNQCCCFIFPFGKGNNWLLWIWFLYYYIAQSTLYILFDDKVVSVRGFITQSKEDSIKQKY